MTLILNTTAVSVIMKTANIRNLEYNIMIITHERLNRKSSINYVYDSRKTRKIQNTGTCRLARPYCH